MLITWHRLFFTGMQLFVAVSALFFGLGAGLAACLCSAGFGVAPAAIALLLSASF